jgi:hypothetical protein
MIFILTIGSPVVFNNEESGLALFYPGFRQAGTDHLNVVFT